MRNPFFCVCRVAVVKQSAFLPKSFQLSDSLKNERAEQKRKLFPPEKHSKQIEKFFFLFRLSDSILSPSFVIFQAPRDKDCLALFENTFKATRPRMYNNMARERETNF
jgi:hypothetical protein